MSSKYLPAISELSASLKLRSKEYLRENSLHGFHYFMDPSKRTYARVGWFICVLASLGATVATIITIWDKFQTSPTLMGMDILPDEVKIYFPDVYLCLNWDLFSVVNNSKLDPDEEPYFKELYEWNWERSVNMTWMESGYAVFFYDLAPDCNDFLSNCSYNTTGCDLFKKVVTPSGICCKFTGKLIKDEDTERILHFETYNYPMRFYMAGKHDIALFDEPMLELINGSLIQFNPIITMTKKDVRFLSVNQRQCTFDDESVSYSHCERNCFIKKIKSLCSCLPWFLAPSSTQECKPKEYSCLIKARKTWSTLDCDCYLPCDHTSYNLKKVERHWDIVQTNISLDQWTHLLHKREISFGWVDLAISFGGIAGFFLGFSVLTSFELWYYFTLRTYCGAVLSAPKKGISITVKEAPGRLLKKKGEIYKNLKKEVKPFKSEFVN